MEQSYLIKPILDREYLSITHGKGIYLYDEHGNAFMDGSSGAVTASIGHGVQEIIEEMEAQAKNVSFVYRSQFTNRPAENLANKMRDIAPGDLHWSFFVNSGSEATETAMKIAIQYWQEKGMKSKNKIISRLTSYHGMTMGALSMSGHIERRKRFEALLDKYPSVSTPYYYRHANGRTIEQCDHFYAAELEKQILQEGSENIAAFIAETITGAAGGVLTPSNNYFKEIKAVCDHYDILFIADEVMTGLGRTGKMFAMEHFGVVPDLMATGKGMSGGYTPIAATLISEKIMQPILTGSKTILTGHTFSSNPQSAATALAVITYIEENNLVEKSEENGKYLMGKLKDIAKDSEIIGDVRGKGLFIGIEFVKNKRTKEPFSRAAAVVEKIVKANFASRLLVYPASVTHGEINIDAIILAPPLTITKTEIDELVARFQKSLVKVEKTLVEELIQ